MTTDTSVAITPQTKVAALLEAYPALEEVLVAMAPPFEKLRNPVLRRTIARVTTLERAASVAGVPLRDLVLRLREAAGQPAEDDLGEAVSQDATEDAPAPWVDASHVVWTVNADELLEAGAHPLAEVQRRVKELTGAELGLIRSSFRPAPLIDLLESQGFRVAVVRSGESFATFIGLKVAG